MNYEKINIAQTHSEIDSFTKTRYRQFFKLFPKHAKSVLDVGCNTGRGGMSLHSLNENLEITGLDCVKNRLKALPSDVYRHKLYSNSSCPFGKPACF